MEKIYSGIYETGLFTQPTNLWIQYQINKELTRAPFK